LLVVGDEGIEAKALISAERLAALMSLLPN
jgi:hypothetical protein